VWTFILRKAICIDLVLLNTDTSSVSCCYKTICTECYDAGVGPPTVYLGGSRSLGLAILTSSYVVYLIVTITFVTRRCIPDVGDTSSLNEANNQQCHGRMRYSRHLMNSSRVNTRYPSASFFCNGAYLGQV
jgi:hypothetical protein